MNANAQKWVAALRSGEFQQTSGRLVHAEIVEGQEQVSYCCLGVACELYAREHEELKREGKFFLYSGTDGRDRGQHGAILPACVRDWLGLQEFGGAYGHMGPRQALTTLNDRGATFQEIADIIEAEPAGLFV